MTLTELRQLPKNKSIFIRWSNSNIVEVLYRPSHKGQDAFTITNLITKKRYRLPVWNSQTWNFSVINDSHIKLGDLFPKSIKQK